MSIIILVGVFVWYQLVSEIYFPPAQTLSRETQELWNVLTKLAQDGGRLVSIPLNDAPEFIYRANIPTLWPLPLVPSTAYLIRKYPIPLLDFAYLSQHFGINFVVVRRSILDREIEEAISGFSLIYENPTHRLFRIAVEK